jgi:hypothetical protein
MDRVVIAVTFSEERGGYVGTSEALSQPIVALSLGSLRKRAEALLPEQPIVVLNLDKAARRERDQRRRRGGYGGAEQWPR